MRVPHAVDLHGLEEGVASPAELLDVAQVGADHALKACVLTGESGSPEAVVALAEVLRGIPALFLVPLEPCALGMDRICQPSHRGLARVDVGLDSRPFLFHAASGRILRQAREIPEVPETDDSIRLAP